jgi:hypothetical protein
MSTDALECMEVFLVAYTITLLIIESSFVIFVKNLYLKEYTLICQFYY